MTHTPGPWIIHRADEYTGDAEDHSKIMSITAENGQTILFTDSGYFKPLEANAALIAAAPAMYEALKAASQALTELDPLAEHHNAIAIDEAIRLAEGR